MRALCHVGSGLTIELGHVTTRHESLCLFLARCGARVLGPWHDLLPHVASEYDIIQETWKRNWFMVLSRVMPCHSDCIHVIITFL